MKNHYCNETLTFSNYEVAASNLDIFTLIRKIFVGQKYMFSFFINKEFSVANLLIEIIAKEILGIMGYCYFAISSLLKHVFVKFIGGAHLGFR